jgi:hypothetical protein
MKYTIALITLFASLAGCSEEPPEEYDRIVISTLLNNTWISECVVDEANSYIPTLTFTTGGDSLYNSGTGTSSKIYHTDDTTCSSLEPEAVDISTFSYTLVNDITVDGTVAEITEATEIDTVNTTEDSVDLGAEEFDIFAIKDRFTLYFGNKEEPYNGTTADLRPTQLSDAVIYTR